MQVGVGRLRVDNLRIFERGGGADISDYPTNLLGAENCSELCYFGMMFGGLEHEWYSLPVYGNDNDPYYLKCFEASAAAPLNGLRLQLPSQFSTLEVDPAVPEMNVSDTEACLRMFSTLHFTFWDTSLQDTLLVSLHQSVCLTSWKTLHSNFIN